MFPQISHMYLKQSSLLFGYSTGMVQIDKHFLKCLCTHFVPSVQSLIFVLGIVCYMFCHSVNNAQNYPSMIG